MSVNNFDVLREMGARNLKIQLAPLDNITNLRKTRHGTEITIGAAGDLVVAIGLHNKFAGGLILADREEFNALRSELLKVPAVKSRAEIETEIAALQPIARDYDTEKQSNDTCLAAGAHDALRWAMGLAEDSISDTLSNKEGEK